jgi:hypothetical protein
MILSVTSTDPRHSPVHFTYISVSLFPNAILGNVKLTYSEI